MARRGHPRRFSGQFQVNIPHDTAFVKIETGGGAVQATGVGGQVEIQTGGGGKSTPTTSRFRDGGDGWRFCGGWIGWRRSKVETGGGNVSIGSVKGMIKAETGGGNISVQSGEQGATLEAGGGNVEIRHCGGRVKATTGGGSIVLGDIGGPGRISTGGGSIHLIRQRGASAQTPAQAALNFTACRGYQVGKPVRWYHGEIDQMALTVAILCWRLPPATLPFSSIPMWHSPSAPAWTWAMAIASVPI